MPSDEDIRGSLLYAIGNGNIERVRQLINSYGLTYSPTWSEGYVLLRNAIETGYTEIAKLLLTYGAKVNSKNIATDTPLHFAVREGDIELVQMLLNRGAKIDAQNQRGNTPLHNAVESKKVETIELLVKGGANVNVKNNNGVTPMHLTLEYQCGITPLHNAVESKKVEIIELLVNQGANVNAADNNGVTPMHLALEYHSEEIINFLLSRVANVNAKGEHGRTYIHIAAERGYLQIVNHLLKHGANVNSAYTSTFLEGYTPLCLAVKEGHEEVVHLLLELGANSNAEGKDAKTALHLAVEKGHEGVLKLLLECGAEVDAQDKDRKSVLHFAVERAYGRFVQLLLERGAKVDAQDKNCKTALHSAVEKGHEGVVKLLLEFGANIDTQDKNGKTILHSAVEKGHSVIIEHVLKHCPDVNNKSNRSALNVAVHGCGKEYAKIIDNLLQYGFTVNPEDVNNFELLHSAVEKGYLKIVEGLLKYGIDVNVLYGTGYMPLHVAAINKQEEVAKLLINYGAHVNAQDETGKTPVFYATKNADVKTTRLLLTKKAIVNPELLTIAVKKECREIVEDLLYHGADVNASDECRRTALHFTVLGEDRESFGLLEYFRHNIPDRNVKGEIAKLLLSRGANANAQIKNGVTTLHAAAKKGYVKVVEALLEYNADVNCTGKTDRTVPQTVYEIKHRRFMGANVNSKDLYDCTPLHIAAHAGHLAVVKILLKSGASVDSKDKYGRTALHIATKIAHEKIVIDLLEHGSDVNIMSKDNSTPLNVAMDGIRSFEMMGASYDYDCYGYGQGYSDDDDYYGYGHGNSDDDDDYCGYDRGICTGEIIAEILEHHVVKMETANLYVSKGNLQSIRHSCEMIDFKNECEKEIASLKSEMVGTANVSFYDILTKGKCQLAMYAGNESIVQVLRSGDYRRKFPTYASMIKCNFRKGETRKVLLEQGNKFFHFLFNSFPWLPHDCTDKIFSYLSDEDLRIFIDACKPVSIQQS